MKIDPVIASYYQDISRKQLILTEKEEINILRAYQYKKLRYQTLILLSQSALMQLEKHYWNLLAGNKSVAKMTSSFNYKRKGHNSKLSRDIKEAVASGNWSKIPLRLSLCDKLLGYVEEDDVLDSARDCRAELREIEETLTCSALQAAINVAHRYTNNVFGIDIKDAVQQANQGIIESIERYDPDYRTKQGERVKFLTYAYQHAVKEVKWMIMKDSRVVRIPKHQLEKIFVIIEAVNILGSLEETSLLTTQVNKLFKQRGRTDRVTEDEVERLMESLGNSVSLDMPIEAGDSEGQKLLKDIIPDEGATPEEHVNRRLAWKALKKIFRTHLTDIEYWVVAYKFMVGSDEKSLREVEELLFENHGYKASRERVNQIKAVAFQKLQQIPRVREILKEVLSNESV